MSKKGSGFLKVCFSVLGQPFGKQRPRHNRFSGTTYTPQQTKEHEENIAWEYRRQCGSFRFPDNAYLDLRVIAYMKIPKSMTKEERVMIRQDRLRPTTTPDWDNIGKLVADALNGVAYKDDKYIVDSQVRKFYSDVPRIDVVIQTATT